eukprot:symbB.v1.2.013896.t1/scaffold969.1/size148062/6
MQYRADDESRCRPVKREGPPVSSASSSSGRAAKRQKMLEMVEATDDDLLSTLSHEELKKVSERLSTLQTGCITRIQATAPAEATNEKEVVLRNVDFRTSHGKALHSPVHFTTARVIAQIGNLPEAEYNAFKLSYLNSAVASGEGELIWPPAPYHWSDDGEHDAEMLLMPLEEYQKIKTACGIKDEQPANKWFKSVLQALTDAIRKRLEENPKFSLDTAFEEFQEMIEEYFDHLPSKVMTLGDYVATEFVAKAAT